MTSFATRAIYAYPWDVGEDAPRASRSEGVRRWLSRLSDLGLNTVKIAGAYHAGKFTRPQSAGSVTYFPEDGTVFFSARPERYGDIRPTVSALAAERDVFADVANDDSLQLNAWLVVLHNTRLGRAHPGSVVRNACDDPYYYSLCPAAPEVRQYAVALCADITTRYPLRGLTLESIGYLGHPHGYHHEFNLLRPNSWRDALLGLCFCKHCVVGAEKKGIPALSLKARVARAIRSGLACDPAVTPDMALHWIIGDIVGDADLFAFIRWRSDTVAALAAEIRDAIPKSVSLSVIPSVQRPFAASWVEGGDAAALANLAGVIDVPLYQPGPELIAADVHDVIRRVGDPTKVHAILRPSYPDLQSQAAVVQAVRILADLGLGGIGFYNFGHLRAESLDWISAALSTVECDARRVTASGRSDDQSNNSDGQ